MNSERGQITVMTIGFLFVVALLAVVVIDASHAFIERRELDNLADGAAIAAADGLDEELFYATGEVSADTRTAHARVRNYVAGTDARVIAVQMTDQSVTVRLERVVDLVLAPPGFPVRTTIVSEATSQLRAGQG